MKQKGHIQQNTNPPKTNNNNKKKNQQINNPHLRLNDSIPYWNQWQLKKKNTNTDYFLLILKYLSTSPILKS